MMALASMTDLPGVIVPGGVTLPPTEGEDAGTDPKHRRPLRPRRDHSGRRRRDGLPHLRHARRRLPVSRHGGHGAGGRRSAWALRRPTRPSPRRVRRSGSTRPRRAAQCVADLDERGLTIGDILTDAAIRNAMVVHAAFGGSTNLLLHIPAVAHAAGLRRPTVHDWIDVNRRVPRLVDVLPNGPSSTRPSGSFWPAACPR